MPGLGALRADVRQPHFSNMVYFFNFWYNFYRKLMFLVQTLQNYPYFHSYSIQNKRIPDTFRKKYGEKVEVRDFQIFCA